ncbi:pirin family protein [Thioalkalivibrio sp.]|uniref:pirin family protein n=1 Tax=Thioalkalivibrio sp. TaxID=2093813 RepID=UPI00356B4698
MMTTTPEAILTAAPTEDGDGVKIQRIHDFNGRLDPFLLLDELKASAREDYIGGFPPHPHRGFETLTYLIHGGLTHEDSMGNRGEVHAGEAQWMSAGRGVIHSEMPLRDSEGLHGFQVWVNLPAARKMDAPRYRDVHATEMVTSDRDGVTLKAIAGSWIGGFGTVEGPLPGIGDGAAMADVGLVPDATLAIEMKAGERLLAYVYEGSLSETLTEGRMAVWSDQDRVEMTARDGASLLLFRGMPLREPISHHGPFVMNTAEEIEQAVEDYRAGRLATPPESVA